MNRKPETPNTAQPNDEDDGVLLKKIAAGDQASLLTFYDRTSRLAYGVVLRLLNDPAVAEEVLLDAYTDVWRQASDFARDRGTTLTRLTTLAARHALDRIGTIPIKSDSPEYVRDLLAARIERESQLKPPASGTVDEKGTTPKPKPGAILTPPQQERSRLPWLVVIALAIAALLAFVAWRQADQATQRLTEQLAAAQADATNLRTLVEVQRGLSHKLEQIDSAIRDRGTRIIHVQGQQDAPSASVLIFWETQKKSWLIDGYLPPPPDGKVYQLWFVLPSQNLNAGLLQTDPLGHIFKTIDVAQDISRLSAAMITLEPEGGSRQPTPPVFAVGKVSP